MYAEIGNPPVWRELANAVGRVDSGINLWKLLHEAVNMGMMTYPTSQHLFSKHLTNYDIPTRALISVWNVKSVWSVLGLRPIIPLAILHCTQSTKTFVDATCLSTGIRICLIEFMSTFLIALCFGWLSEANIFLDSKDVESCLSFSQDRKCILWFCYSIFHQVWSQC